MIGTHGPRMLALTAKYAQAYNTSWHALPGERWGRVKTSLEQAGVTQRVTVGLMVKGDDDGDDAFGVRCEPEALAEAFRQWAGEGIDELIVLLDPVTLDAPGAPSRRCTIAGPPPRTPRISLPAKDSCRRCDRRLHNGHMSAIAARESADMP